MIPWVIAFVIGLMLLKAAYGNKALAQESPTAEGTKLGVLMMTILAIAALAFILFAVVLAA
jgi:hypothetical protein